MPERDVRHGRCRRTGCSARWATSTRRTSTRALQGVQRGQHGLVRRHRRRAGREERRRRTSPRSTRTRPRSARACCRVTSSASSTAIAATTGRRPTSSSACAARWARRSSITMLRPKKGSTNGGDEKTFTLTRAMINYPNLKSEMIGKVGYMRLGQFNANAEGDMRKAIAEPRRRRARSRSCSTCAATRAACSTRRSTSPRCSSRTA